MNSVYIPAVSVGATVLDIKKRNKSLNGKDLRFYENVENVIFKHPAVLISAAHNYDKDSKDDFGYVLDNKKIILGDSGGFQIATGATKYTEEIVEKIFNWLESQTNYAMNLDLPPFLNGQVAIQSKVEDYLKKTVNNMTYFEKHQTGKTKFMNVLQGRCEEHFDLWYNAVRNFEFEGGWGIGSATSISPLITLLAFFYLLQKGEIDKFEKKGKLAFFHFLGVSSRKLVPILVYIQNKLNKMGYKHICISFDSSSPFMSATYGRYNIGQNKVITIAKSSVTEKNVNLSVKLPCSCPVCNGLTWNDLLKCKSAEKDSFSSIFYTTLSLHNLYLFLDNKKQIELVISSENKEFIESYFTTAELDAFKAIDGIFESKNYIEKVYFYKDIFRQFDSLPEKETFSDEFFE